MASGLKTALAALLLAAIFLFGANSAQATVLYVDTAAAGADTGASFPPLSPLTCHWRRTIFAVNNCQPASKFGT